MASPRRISLSTIRWNLLHSVLIWIYRGKVPETGRGVRPGKHSLAAWYFLRGSGEVEIDGKATSASENHWLLVKPVARIQSFSPDAEILSIRFQAEWPDGSSLFDEGLSLTLSDKKHPALKKTAEELLKVVAHCAPSKARSVEAVSIGIDFSSHIKIEQKFLSWLLAYHDALVREGLEPNLLGIDDNRVREAVRSLRRWPLEEPFREEQLAKHLSISKFQLERLLVTATGVTSRKFIDGRRVTYAKERLGLGRESVKEIAHQVGFKHSSSFCNWFRKRTGYYPSFFAKQGVRF